MKNLIGKEWVDSSNGLVIEVTNPATRELIDTVPNASEQDIDNAVKIAKEAYKDWEKTPLYERGEILKKFADLVENKKNELAKLLSDETGKPISEAIIEIGNVKTFINGYVEKAKHLYGISIPSGIEPGQEKTIQYTKRYPVGVVGCIIPFNFPVDLFGQKVPSALIMGNAVIVKPSTYNPLTLHNLVSLLIEAGVPYGVIQVVSGDGVTAGKALASHPDLDLISVTGSTTVGMETMANASHNLTHVMLELGGNDAFILCEDGDIDLAVEETIFGRLYNTGQVCCASKRFLIHKNVKDEYITKLIQKIQTLKIGMPSDPTTKIGCLINEKAAIRVEDQVRSTIEAGARLIYGGRRNGAFFEPTIIDNINENMEVAKDMEIFGPVISIIEFESNEDALRIANQSNYGLCGNVITRNMETAFNIVEELEVGGAIINGASFYRSAEMPFGGWKHSGMGNEGISSTLEEMSKLKTIVIKNILK